MILNYSFFQVILGLICPLYIIKLEFKSKEELQLMPQTEEEHLENESLEEGREDERNHNPDAEVWYNSYSSVTLFLLCFSILERFHVINFSLLIVFLKI